MKALLLTAIVSFQVIAFSQFEKNRTYFELNGGIAMLSSDLDGGIFPGLSCIFGRQVFINNSVFFEFQGGFALPSIATAKTGFGFTADGIGASAGLRIFPMMGYVQVHFPTKNGQFNISAEASPLVNNDPNFLSFGAKNLFTCGYQWNIGKSRKKKEEGNKLSHVSELN